MSKRLTTFPASMIRARGAQMFPLQPPHPPHFPDSSLKGFFGCLQVWASRAWVNAATHHLTPTPSHPHAALTATARCSLLPYFHFLTHSPRLLWFWTAEES